MGKVNFDITPQGPYFSIIRSAIWQSPLDTSGWKSGIDWDSIIQNYDNQSILPLVAPVLVENNAIIGLPNEKIDYILDNVADNVRKHYKVREVFERVTLLLEANSLKPILVKGEALASKYSQPNLRAVGDIDLYLLPEDCPLAVELLSTICETNRGNSTHHFQMVIDGVEVEIHHHLDEVRDYRVLKDSSKRTEELVLREIIKSWPQQQYNDYLGLNLRVLDSYSDFLFNFTHLVKHLISGEGIRQFIDIVMLLSRPNHGIRRTQLKLDLKELKLKRIWNYVAIVMVKYLGLPVEQCPIFDRRKVWNEKILMRTLIVNGNLGQHKPDFGSVSRDGLIKGTEAFFQSNQLQFALFPKVFLNKLMSLIWKQILERLSVKV